MVDPIYEAIFAHANHNKRLPAGVIGQIKKRIGSPQYPLYVAPQGKVYRGDHTTQERFQKDINVGKLEPKGIIKVTLNLEPGSSWSYDLEQATYHATSGTLNPMVEVLYSMNPISGSWLDLREFYKLSQFRGLRFEREVICLEKRVFCKAEYKLPYSYDRA